MRATGDHCIRYARIAVLTVWAWFLGWLLLPAGTGQLAKLLHPDLWWLVQAGLVVILMFIAATICNRAPVRTGIFQKISAISGMLLLLLPILYFSGIGQGQLGEDTLVKRTMPGGGIGGIAPLSQEEQDDRPIAAPAARMPPAPGDFEAVARSAGGKAANGEAEKSGDDDFQILVISPSAQIDKRLTLLGMVHLNEAFGPGMFYCFRFRINCCAADAVPVGVMVRHHDVGKLETGGWVRVEGSLRLNTLKDSSVKLVFEAETVVAAETPEFPYVL